MRVAWAAALMILAAPTGVGTASGAEATDRTAKVFTLAPGASIQLDATIADVTITGSSRSDVSVAIVRHAPDAAGLAKFPAVLDERPDGLHISAVQADQGRDAALRSEITIDAPLSAIFQSVRVFEGRVKLVNLRAACDVGLERGPIDATALAGRVRLEAGIGSVEVKQSELTPGGMMRLRVFNGVVRVRFARRPASARILAVTFNGSLTSDIPLTMKDRFGPRFGETTIGNGDPVMSIDVVKGDIAIKVG